VSDRRRAPRAGKIVPRLIVDDVYGRIMELIMDGHVEPGDALSIDALAREFEVSSSPIREALARLEHTGLVRRYALRGYRVAPPLTADELSELIDARQVIEPAVVRAACAARTDDLIEALRETITEMEQAPRGEDFASYRPYVEADQRFHRLIVEAASNRFLASAYDNIGSHVQRFRLFAKSGVTDAADAIAEHRAIADAVAGGDAEAAVRAMLDHLEGIRARVLAELAEDQATASGATLRAR